MSSNCSCLTAPGRLPSAWATCSTSDLGGNWQFYVQLTRDFANELMRCVIKVKNNGAVRGGNCVFVGGFNDGAKKSVEGGSIKISRTCTTKGEVTVSDDPFFLSHAKMAKDKNHFSGIGTFQDFFRAYFTAVKK